MMKIHTPLWLLFNLDGVVMDDFFGLVPNQTKVPGWVWRVQPPGTGGI